MVAFELHLRFSRLEDGQMMHCELVAVAEPDGQQKA